MKFRLYILYSGIWEKYYIGTTGNLEDRLRRHNEGRSKYTKSGIPWKFIYSEEFLTRADACRREKQLKSWKSRKRLEELIRRSYYNK